MKKKIGCLCMIFLILFFPILIITMSNNQSLNVKFLEEKYGDNYDEIINYLIEEYLYYTLFIKIFDSRIAEESARRLAMENATKNADELIDDLNLEYNKIRQSNITSEINEVSSASKIAKR